MSAILSGATLAAVDPATGETIGSVPHATAADLDRALEAAERAAQAVTRAIAHR